MIEQINNRRRLKMGGDDFEKKWQEIEIAAKKGEKIEQEMENIKDSLAYKFCAKSVWLDFLLIDPILGYFIPLGNGDILCSFSIIPFIYVALIKLHSIPLTLSIINNSLKDLLIGLFPYIGDFIDIAHMSNKKNYSLLKGFIEDDEEVKTKVNEDAIKCGIEIGVLIFIIYNVFIKIKLLGEYIWTQIHSIF